MAFHASTRRVFASRRRYDHAPTWIHSRSGPVEAIAARTTSSEGALVVPEANDLASVVRACLGQSLHLPPL